MFMIKSLVATLLILLPASALYASENRGGFSLGSTRVIYNAENSEASLVVNNTLKNSPFLAQSWITSYDGSDKPPFVITPPLYRQDEGSNMLRIRKTNGFLKEDRESAFWINVKAIPGQSKKSSDDNSVSFAYVLRIKMFYRPDNLKMDVKDAYKNVDFSQVGESIKAINPTPYFITFNKLSVNGVDLKEINAMLPPKGEMQYKLPKGMLVKKVEYKAITDLGGLTPLEIKSPVN